MTQLRFPEGTFVVVASGEVAKTFRVKGGALQHAGDWNPTDLADDGPSGKTPPDQSDRDLNEATFSKQIAERLYKSAHAGAFDRLILIADPVTLGEIRPLLHSTVTDKLVLQQAKTLINSPVEDIERALGE
ncbi:host attachment family protein [uncultured Brevundimonas sp.]|uniref:host attachment family protein n=1 Tax=uncultured Brevundimonas sp. TaxID=213418 RepID=UPI0030ED8AAD|tara:strand:- start:681 stop:1073 length:393 start_codon:yes stop_codon:yes gene_type:complete